MALQLAKECGAHHLVKADGNEVARVLELTKGKGAEAVIDFVGEGDAIAKGLAMTRNAGSYYIVGYGGSSTRKICISLLLFMFSLFYLSV